MSNPTEKLADAQAQQPADSILKKPEPEKKEELTYTITVSGEKAERAVVQGGLFVLTIPINKLSRPLIIGTAWDAFHSLVGLLDELDALKQVKKKSLREKLTEGVTSFIGAAKA